MCVDVRTYLPEKKVQRANNERESGSRLQNTYKQSPFFFLVLINLDQVGSLLLFLV